MNEGIECQDTISGDNFNSDNYLSKLVTEENYIGILDISKLLEMRTIGSKSSEDPKENILYLLKDFSQFYSILKPYLIFSPYLFDQETRSLILQETIGVEIEQNQRDREMTCSKNLKLSEFKAMNEDDEMVELSEEDDAYNSQQDGEFQIITEEYIKRIIKEEKLKMNQKKIKIEAMLIFEKGDSSQQESVH